MAQLMGHAHIPPIAPELRGQACSLKDYETTSHAAVMRVLFRAAGYVESAPGLLPIAFSDHVAKDIISVGVLATVLLQLLLNLVDDLSVVLGHLAGVGGRAPQSIAGSCVVWCRLLIQGRLLDQRQLLTIRRVSHAVEEVSVSLLPRKEHPPQLLKQACQHRTTWPPRHQCA